VNFFERIVTVERMTFETSQTKTIYIFRCGTTAIFALTADRMGRNLPLQVCGPAGWHFERSVTLQSDKDKRRRESTRATLAAIAKHGFHLTHAAIHAMPIDYAASVAAKEAR
jgi:hypothetical protein